MRIPLLFTFTLLTSPILAQVTEDTLVLQDFDGTAPVWTYTGTPNLMNGMTGTTAAPANTEIGIGGSYAWETNTDSDGDTLLMANFTVPGGYDSLAFKMKLAGMNLVGTTGGPDNLDYVLIQISTDGGATYYNRMRIRGSVNNNSFWPYNAGGAPYLAHLPQSEITFSPANTGLCMADGPSTITIAFPNTVSQFTVKVISRSSSASDSWLVDNMMIVGYTNCNVNSSFSYTGPTTICNGQTLNFTNTSTGSIVSQQWLVNDSLVSTSSNANISFPAAGTYNIQLVSSSAGCSDSSTVTTITVNDCSGIHEATFTSQDIYPNPVENTLQLNQRVDELMVYSVDGKQVLQVMRPTQSVNVQNLLPGTYILKVKMNERNFAVRFVKK